METNLRPSRGGQPRGSRIQGPEQWVAGGPADAGVDEALIEAEGVRTLFRRDLDQSFLGLRALHWVGWLGALYIGAATHYAGAAPWRQVIVWWAIVALASTPVTLLVRIFALRPREPDALPRWALARTLMACVEIAAWGLGPVLLRVPGEPASVMIPTGGIVNAMVVAVFVASSFTPAMICALLSLLTFPALYMALADGRVENALSICLFGAIPFVLVIGVYAARESRAAIASRLKLAEWLEWQKIQTDAVQEARLERNRFFSAASHDLRQPLHALGLYLSLLRSAGPDDRAEVEARIADCGAILDRQFHSIMGVASTDSQLAAEAPAAIPLGDAMNRVAAIFRPLATEKGIGLEVVPTLATARVDPEIFDRLLSNLVSNAVKYTRTGRVRVRTVVRDGVCRVLVSDTGVGISRQDQAHIFRDFYRCGHPADQASGAGLGLGIVARLSEGTGWPVFVWSRPGRGSVFGFDVPAATEASPRAAPGAEGELGSAPPRRILVVDDDERVLDAMRRRLAAWGYDVVACGGAAAALSEVQRAGGRLFWLALIDARLRGSESGIDLAAVLREALPGRFEAVILSAESGGDMRDAARAQGFEFLAKPVKPIALRSWLARGAGLLESPP